MTKKIDIKSLLIGFLLATSAMLFMGASSDNGNGRYQNLSGTAYASMIDTQTGEAYSLRHKRGRNFYWVKVTRSENWIVK